MKNLLKVENLNVGLLNKKTNQMNQILKNINIHLCRNECVGIIGGSGAGKSVLLNSIINSLNDPLQIYSGNVLLEDVNILELDEKMMQKEILGKKIATICPNPHWRLDPIDTIGSQIGNIYKSHFKVSNEMARKRVIDLLKLVGIPDAEKRYNSYPVELSGGMAQRVLVTMALICKPEILLADEPTGGLDVTIQIQVFNLIRSLIKNENLSTIVASRDIGLIYHLCNRIYVINEGEIVESGERDEIINSPIHPYTAKLIRLSESDHKIRLSPNFKKDCEKDIIQYRKFVENNKERIKNEYISANETHFVQVMQ